MVSNFSAIEKIFLFGSTAQSQDRLNSDIDIAIVGRENINFSKKNEINDVVTSILLEYGFLINWIYFEWNDWEEEYQPIVRVIHQEGQLLWEREKMT